MRCTVRSGSTPDIEGAFGAALPEGSRAEDLFGAELSRPTGAPKDITGGG
jgi:hypothetical protein